MTVDIELREQSNGNGLEFSATYAIWNGHHTDWICGGYAVENLKKFIPNNTKVSINIGMLPRMYNKPSKFIKVLFSFTATANGFVYSFIH